MWRVSLGNDGSGRAGTLTQSVARSPKVDQDRLLIHFANVDVCWLDIAVKNARLVHRLQRIKQGRDELIKLRLRR